MIARGLQGTDGPDEAGLFLFDLQHFAPFVQVFGQSGDEQHFQRGSAGVIALQVEGFERGDFGAHQAKIADGEALFGFAQFGWKQQGQGHFKGQVDQGFVVGRDGQEEFFEALFFE